MRKGTIFKYEFKRLLLSKEYILLLIATLAYCVSLLRGMVIFGANYTAPFSQLTFLTYCASLAPLLFILLLLLCAKQFKSSERGMEAIISAMQMPLPVLRLLRYGALACAFLIAAALPLMACFAFYRLVFDYKAVGELFLSGVLLLLPSAVILFGTAMLLGNKGAAAVYVLLAAVLILSVFQISLPGFIDIIGSSVTQTLDSGEQAFAFSPEFIAGRMTLLVVGAASIILSLQQAQRKA